MLERSVKHQNEPSVAFCQWTLAAIQFTFHTDGVNAAKETGLFSFPRTPEGRGFVLKDAEWWITLFSSIYLLYTCFALLARW